MKVEFTYRDGKTKAVDSKIADVLVKLGRGTYLTTDLGIRARPVKTRTQRVVLEPETGTEEVLPPGGGRVQLDDDDLGTGDDDGAGSATGTEGNESEQIDLDAMTVDELRDYAKSVGAQHHHAAGAEKIKAAIRERTANPD